MEDKKPRGEPTAVYIDFELLKWIDEMVEKKLFANRSHAVQACLYNYKQQLENRKNE